MKRTTNYKLPPILMRIHPARSSFWKLETLQQTQITSVSEVAVKHFRNLVTSKEILKLPQNKSTGWKWPPPWQFQYQITNITKHTNRIFWILMFSIKPTTNNSDAPHGRAIRTCAISKIRNTTTKSRFKLSKTA